MAKHGKVTDEEKQAKVAKLLNKSQTHIDKLGARSAAAAVEEAWRRKPSPPKDLEEVLEKVQKSGKKRKVQKFENPPELEPVEEAKRSAKRLRASREEADKAFVHETSIDPASKKKKKKRVNDANNLPETGSTAGARRQTAATEEAPSNVSDGNTEKAKQTANEKKKQQKQKKKGNSAAKNEAGDAQKGPGKSASGSPSSKFPDNVQRVIDSLLDSSTPGTLSDRLNADHPHFDKQLRATWKSYSKKERAAIVEADQARLKGLAKQAEAALKPLPFTADDDDHCETAPEAYQDLAPFLRKVAETLGKSPATLKIYDPYYCAGAVVGHLKEAGFPNVYNRCEDFYQVIEKEMVPDHDVLVTNPPYSGEHVEKLLNFCRSNKKPFFLLMPNYFCVKSYYAPSLGPTLAGGMVYLFPQKRYVYWTPKGRRSKDRVQSQHSRAGGNRTSPFVSFWYINTSPAISTESLLSWWRDPATRQALTAEARKSPKSEEKSQKFQTFPTLGRLEELPPAALKDCPSDAVSRTKLPR